MNERIRELAFKAANGILSFDAEGDWHLSESEAEKFAELIVRECIKLAVPEDSYRDEWFKAKCDVMDRIKQHFGVE